MKLDDLKSYECFKENMLDKFWNSYRGEKSYRAYLSSLFQEYIKFVECIDDFKEHIGKLNDNIDCINNAIVCYNEANIQGALIQIDNYFIDSKTIDLNIYFRDLNSKKLDACWYKARKLDEGRSSYTSKEMFHVPFNLRYKLENYRFSISGYPCLYLAYSILGCWEELKRPVLDNLCVAGYKFTNKDLRILDLSIPDKEDYSKLQEENRDYLISLLLFWPLIMACSIKTKHPNEPFKEEYIVPQLIMQSSMITKLWKVYGVAFTSTQRDDLYGDDIYLHLNLAIPVRKVKDEGYCDDLENMFIVSKGVSIIEAEIKNQIGIKLTFNDEDEDANFGSSDGTNDYKLTKFGQMEEYIKRTFDK